MYTAFIINSRTALFFYDTLEDHLRYAYALVFEAQYVLGCRPFAIQYNALKSTSFDPSYTAVRKKKTAALPGLRDVVGT